MSTSALSEAEFAQLGQTIEMFEVITQSQPQDYQSLEILKEAYTKLGRDPDVLKTSRRIAEAYVQMGQLSSAILEYETILQRQPNDAEAQAALREIEGKASNFPQAQNQTEVHVKKHGDTARLAAAQTKTAAEVDDGRRTMHKLFVETKMITEDDFKAAWPSPDMHTDPRDVLEPFLQAVANKGLAPLDKCIRMIAEKSRTAFLPLQLYDVDMDLARSFPAPICRRWCVVPFDRMSKSILVATVNPFNQQAARELAAATPNRLLWYMAPPTELIKLVRKAFH